MGLRDAARSMTPRIALYHFTCGRCSRRSCKDVSEEPSVEEIARVRRLARCSVCGSKGSVEIIRDNGWTGDMIDQFKTYVETVNSNG